MTLAELQTLIQQVNTMGFKPEEVQVQLKNSWTQADMTITKTQTIVEAGENIQPIVRIDLSC